MKKLMVLVFVLSLGSYAFAGSNGYSDRPTGRSDKGTTAEQAVTAAANPDEKGTLSPNPDEKGTLSSLKIGVIDLQGALNTSEPGKAAKAELEELIRQRQVMIDEKMMAAERFKEEMQRQALVLTDRAMAEKQDALDRMERDLQRLIEDSNDELQREQREKELAILEEMDDIITGMGKTEGYALILPVDVIVYFSEAVDITGQVIKKYNESKKEK